MSNEVGKWSFHAWLELPYFVAVNHAESFPAEYRPNAEIELQLRIRNNLAKVGTGNWWERRQAVEEWAERARAGEEVERPDLAAITRYVPRSKLEAHVKELEADDSVSYVHVEELESIVELQAELPDSLAPEDDFFDPELLPSTIFFSQEVLPRLGKVIDAYRIATLPAMRYEIHPVSEPLVPWAFIEIQDPGGEAYQLVRYGLDPKGHGRAMAGHADRLGVQDRFESALSKPEDVQAEEHLAASYYLYHMRRWTEAVVVASAVVDQLLEELVYDNAPDELADLLWKSYRNRVPQNFNKVLPALGLPKLSDLDNALWSNFREARKYRGSVAHGVAARAFDKGEAEQVKTHLTAIYKVSKWLSDQVGREWALDLKDEGELLRPFP